MSLSDIQRTSRRPEPRQLDQLWYTWSTRGWDNLDAGFRVRAASRGLGGAGNARVAALESYLNYRLPVGSAPEALDGESAPRSLAMVQLADERVLLHKVYARQDGRGRYGNYFIHVLAGLPRTFTADKALCLWRYSDGLLWQLADDQGQDVELPTLDLGELERRLRARYEQLWRQTPAALGPDFLRLTEEQRQAALAVLPGLLEAFLEQQDRLDRRLQSTRQPADGRVPPIYLVALPEQALYLIWALVRLLPPALAARLTFDTYEYSYTLQEQANSMQASATSIVATCPDPGAASEEWRRTLPEAFYLQAWAFNLRTSQASPSAGLRHADDFAHRASAAFGEEDLTLIDEVRSEVAASEVSSFLKDYQRWLGNRGHLSLERLELRLREENPQDWKQHEVRQALLDYLSDEQAGERLLRLLREHLEHLGQRRQGQEKSAHQLDRALKAFETEAETRLRQSFSLSLTARERLLQVLSILRTAPDRLREQTYTLLRTIALYNGPGLTPERSVRLLRVAAPALADAGSEGLARECEPAVRLLLQSCDWQEWLNLLSLPFPPAWGRAILQRLLDLLTTNPGQGHAWLRSSQHDWQRLLLLLRQSLSDASGSGRDPAIRVIYHLLRGASAGSFDLLALSLEVFRDVQVVESLLVDPGQPGNVAAIVRETMALEQTRRADQRYDEAIDQLHRDLLSPGGVRCLQSESPLCGELILRMFRLVWQAQHPGRELLLTTLFSAGPAPFCEQLLSVAWPNPRLAARLLLDNLSTKGDFFYRSPAGRQLYARAVRGAVLASPQKMVCLRSWLRAGLSRDELEGVLSDSDLQPAERDEVLEAFGLYYLTHYPDLGVLYDLTLSYLHTRSVDSPLPGARSAQFMKDLATKTPPVPVYLCELARCWLHIGTALSQKKVTPELEPALRQLTQSIEDAQTAEGLERAIFARLGRRQSKHSPVTSASPDEKRPQSPQGSGIWRWPLFPGTQKGNEKKP